MEALVPVQVGEVQQRQLRLGCQAQAREGVHLHARQGGQVLGVQEEDAAFAKQPALGIVQAVEDRQAVEHLLPQLVIERVAG
ncbi:hypothetical protein D3C77_698910 [compost metagenome]